MKSFVVDASVVIKWYVPEIHAISATRLLQLPKIELLAPDLIFAEMGSILWKKQRLQELTRHDAGAIFQDFKNTPLQIHNNEFLTEAAWKIATEFNVSFYDSLYVALAQTEASLLVTADRALCNNLKHTPLVPLLLWVEDIKKI